eukprot:CAMPEP_0119352714 /NCGR_PEP_ID=MMETSP1334-20130426/1966_1 /TAXON_ID=127549 /ORGANISM="Calcidiscus leptoporus, Strain RCC1130" /LENGTH=477 /DNA_ID=CAMNT_0007365817 /DNA_START=95 /DNA_END=1528 /DNA_ORIENTATION=-
MTELRQAPFLALGMICSPDGFQRRVQVRTTMLLVGQSAGDSLVAFRFVVGGELLRPHAGRAGEMEEMGRLQRQIESEAAAHGDLVILPNAIDGGGRGHNKQCACIEKLHAWYQHALRAWPAASWYGKTEDDTYVNIRALLFDLRRLARRDRSPVYYGLMAVCSTFHGGVGRSCWKGDFESCPFSQLNCWEPYTSQRRIDPEARRQMYRACGHAPMGPLATGPLDVQSSDLARKLWGCEYLRDFMVVGREWNRRTGGCNMSHPNTSTSAIGSKTCDCVMAHWLAECMGSTSLTVADMGWTKAHHYAAHPGGGGWVSPSAASVAVHFLKALPQERSGPTNSVGGEWMHVHNTIAAVNETRFPPLLWSYRRHRFTKLEPAVHAWYHAMCGKDVVSTARLHARANQRRTSRQGAEAARRTGLVGGNPSSWPGYGCHPQRFLPLPVYVNAEQAAAQTAVKQKLLARKKLLVKGGRFQRLHAG